MSSTPSGEYFVHKTLIERDELREWVARVESKRDWALEKLREMNANATKIRKAVSFAPKGSPTKPATPLDWRSAESIVAWVRYLRQKVKSQRGEVLLYGVIKSQEARAKATPEDAAVSPSGAPVGETPSTVGENWVGTQQEAPVSKTSTVTHEFDALLSELDALRWESEKYKREAREIERGWFNDRAALLARCEQLEKAISTRSNSHENE